MFEKENSKLTAIKACVTAVDSLLMDYRTATNALVKAVFEGPKEELHEITVDSLAYRIREVAEDLDHMGSMLRRLTCAYLRSL